MHAANRKHTCILIWPKTLSILVPSIEINFIMYSLMCGRLLEYRVQYIVKHRCFIVLCFVNLDAAAI